MEFDFIPVKCELGDWNEADYAVCHFQDPLNMHSILHREKAQLNFTHRNIEKGEDGFNSTTTVVKRKRLVPKKKEAVDQTSEEPINVDGSDSDSDAEDGRLGRSMESYENSIHLPLMLKKSNYFGKVTEDSNSGQLDGRDSNVDEDDGDDDDDSSSFHGLSSCHSKPVNLSKQSCDIYESGKNVCDANNLGVLGQNELMMMGLSRHLMYLSYLNFLAAYNKAQEAEAEAESSQSSTAELQSSHDCSVCKRSFDQKGTLRAHMDSCHKGMRFHCSDCGKKFSSRSCLKLHVDSLHKGLKYDCNVCGKSFTQKGHLNIHVESIHNRVKFDCHMCSRVFSQKSTLKVHVDSVHKGLKYVCSICDESFNWRIQLKQHIGLHHNGVKFTCTICNINLYHKRSLNKHMALFH